MEDFQLKGEVVAAPAPPPTPEPKLPLMPLTLQAAGFDVRLIYGGSDGGATIKLYAHLQTLGPAGIIAMNLFRASKCSERAKKYRGGNARGRFRDQAYERKNWSLANLCDVLAQHGTKLGISWGWKHDPAQSFHCWCLYIDLPGVGQVSYHSANAIGDQRYSGEWDGFRNSAERVQIYTTSVLLS